MVGAFCVDDADGLVHPAKGLGFSTGPCDGALLDCGEGSSGFGSLEEVLDV